MQPRLTYITLGVQDLVLMTNWYKQVFGWKHMGEQDNISSFLLNGIILGLFPAEDLAGDAGVPQDGNGFKRVSFSINFGSAAEVDIAFDDAEAKGATAVKQPQEVFWGGYSGYLVDPEGNLWELAHNPFLKLDEQGNVVSPN
jgi:predicted enzyme related to lactoylglutathione lyase